MAEKTTHAKTWWGVRYSWSGGQHVTAYGDEEDARRELARKPPGEVTHTLVRREIVTISEDWTEVPGD